MTPHLGPASYGFQESEDVWKSGRLDDWQGPYYGFRHVEMTLGHGEEPVYLGHYASWLQREHPDAHRFVADRTRKKTRPVPGQQDLYAFPLPFDLHHSAWLADRFAGYLKNERRGDKPFFAFVGFPDPHHPFTPCEETLKLFADAPVKEPVDPDGESWTDSRSRAVAQYRIEGLSMEERKTIIRYTYAMVHQIDRAVGRIVTTLEERGLWDDTIVVFTADHGDYLCDHSMLYKSYGAADALLHVPFILRAPGAGLPPHVDIPMSNCDVLPTLAAMLNVDLPEPVHGRNITEVLASGEDHHALAFATRGDPGTTNYTAYDGGMRFTTYPGLGYDELYDHREDPGECVNRADDPACRERREFLLHLLQDRLMQYTNPIAGRVCAW